MKRFTAVFTVFSCYIEIVSACTGMSSAASSALFYATRIADVPAVFMAEPDDVTVLSGENTHTHAAIIQVVDLSWTADTLVHMRYSVCL